MSISCHQQIKLPATTACSGAVGLLQRKCACGGSPGLTAECKECREKRSQHHATNETGPTAAPLVVHDVLRSPGQPLDAATRNFMEPRFGHDFSLVRVHTGTQADESARAVSARAYTVGRDIVFAKGQYDPGIEQGRKLLAHELTHTIQQLSTASAAAAPPDSITIEPAETALERAAEENGRSLGSTRKAPARNSRIALQRAPANDMRWIRDEAAARYRGQVMANRIRNHGILSKDAKAKIKRELAYFEGPAREVYIQQIRPALARVRSLEEIEKPAEPAPALPKYPDYNAAVDNIVKNRNYIDNDIKMVSYYTAELALIHYRDGSTLELGLVPKWMKPPFEEVDYHTPKEDFKTITDPNTGATGFFREADMPDPRDVPRNVTLGDVTKSIGHRVRYVVEPKSLRIVPTIVNMLTAPTLCRVLLESEGKFVEQTKMAVEIGEKGTGIMAFYVGAGGGWAKGPGSFLTRSAPVATRTLSPAAKKLAGELDNLLAAGGAKTITVEGVELAGVGVSRQGSVLAVRRFMSKLPEALRGQGTGTRVTAAFEDAAAEIGRLNGAKTVTIDLGIIINPGWRTLLEARGYVHVLTEGRWVKTIKL